MADPLEYLIAAAAYQYAFIRSDTFSFPKDVETFLFNFNVHYGASVDENLALLIIRGLADYEFIELIEDKYAGLIISANRSQIDRRFEQLASSNSEVFIARIDIADIFYGKVLANEELWRDIAALGDRKFSVDTSAVPASDRVVTILHNSPESLQINTVLDEIISDLQTNNEVASAAGDDRERLVSEAKASKDIIEGERVSSNKLQVLVLGFLQEIAKKFKDESVKWGVGQVISILSRMLGL